jgi:hypothetical protein
MKRSPLKIVHEPKLHDDDLSLLPPHSEHPKYLQLADDFLNKGSTESEHSNVIPTRRAVQRLVQVISS